MNKFIRSLCVIVDEFQILLFCTLATDIVTIGIAI